MKFSVLIPVYNTEKYLDECIQSVLDQTYQDFEIVLVDDGSTDTSPQKCDFYQKKLPDKIKVIHKENQGLISARRVGIANAESDYCIFVDSDDYIKPNLLETLNSVLSKDNTIDVLMYSFLYITEGKQDRAFHKIAENGMVWTEKNKSELYEKLLFSNDVTPICIKAVKTSFLKSDSTEYSVYFGKNMAEDLLQSLYLITYAKCIKYIYEPLYCYRYNNESISRNYSYESIQKMNTIHVYEKILEYLPIWNMNTEETITRLRANWFSGMMYLFFKACENVRSLKERKVIQSYNWTSMIPDTDVDGFAEYVNQVYIKVYKWYLQNKYLLINDFFTRKRWYKKYKRLKLKDEK